MIEAGPGVHIVVRHAEACAVLSNARQFSNVMPDRGPGQQFLHELDAPEHTRLRTLLMSVVCSRAIEDLRPRVADLWLALAADLMGRNRIDLVGEFVVPGVRESFACALGIPKGDCDQVYGWIVEMRDDAAYSPPGAFGRASANAAQSFQRYVLAQLAVRSRRPSDADDLLTRLANVRDHQGVGFAPSEIVAMARLMCQAGVGSTARAISNLLFQLVVVPERYRRVRDDRRLIPSAIDESLRHDPPGSTLERVCIDDTIIGGASVSPGDTVVINIMSANRDDRRRDDPDSFNLDRHRPIDHLAFGRGPHRCIGGPLARLNMQTALASLLDVMPQVGLRPGFRCEMESSSMWGLRSLDVEVFQSPTRSL